MTTPVVACIPTIGLSPYLEDLVHDLWEHGIDTRLYVNSDGVKECLLIIDEGWPHGGHVELVHRPGDSIYAEWNDAAQWAVERDAYLLVLNDDVVIPATLHQRLADALDGHPEYGLLGVAGAHVYDQAPYRLTHLSHALGNRYAFSAWCFIARAKAWQDVDERYRVWYGDDDLIWKMNAAGHLVGALEGVGVLHHTSTTTMQLPWAMQAAHEDGILWMNTR